MVFFPLGKCVNVQVWFMSKASSSFLMASFEQSNWTTSWYVEGLETEETDKQKCL